MESILPYTCPPAIALVRSGFRDDFFTIMPDRFFFNPFSTAILRPAIAGCHPLGLLSPFPGKLVGGDRLLLVPDILLYNQPQVMQPYSPERTHRPLTTS